MDTYIWRNQDILVVSLTKVLVFFVPDPVATIHSIGSFVVRS